MPPTLAPGSPATGSPAPATSAPATATRPTLDCLIREPAEVYHAKASANLSSHALADFRRCPLLYRRKQLGLIEDRDSPAYLVGRAAHTLVLEGRAQFDAEYVVGGPINEKTGKPYGANTKAFAEWAAAQNRAVLTDDQAATVERMAASVADHAEAQALLEAGVAEGVVRVVYRDHPCQARIDWLNPAPRIVDIKTCDDLDWFESDARRFGYVHQLAFYRGVLAIGADVGVTDLPVHIVAVEKKEPFRVGVWRVGQDVLAIAQQDNEQAMARLRHCIATDTWPTGYEQPRIFDHL